MSELPGTPDFHDGHLTGLVLVDGRLDLYCATVQGEEYVWRIRQLRRLCAESFREGNIIFEITLHPAHTVPALVTRAFGHSGAEEPKWLSVESARLQNVGGSVIEVTSSYGCELIAVFDGDHLVERVPR